MSTHVMSTQAVVTHTVITLAVLLAVTSASVVTRAQAIPPTGVAEHRGATLARLVEAQSAYLANPGSSQTRMEYARLCYETGRFEDALAALEPLLIKRPSAADVGTEVLLLASKAAYVTADYATTEDLLKRILELEPDNASAAIKLALVYFQTNQYHLCRDLPADVIGGRFAHFDLMLAFDDAPNRVTWAEGDETEVPFLVTDPLPVVEVEVNGHRLKALIDTGADSFILDPSVAKELGIEVAASMTGMFAGGMEAEVGLAKASSLRLGGATLHSVPLALLPTGAFEIGGHTFSGIVGTGVLKQFLATMDYPNDRLVLRAPGGEAAARFYAGEAGRVRDEIPFYLQSTHFLMAHGSLNGVDGLLFHIDSGLAGEAAFGAPRPTLDYVGIAVPEVSAQEGFVGGGGGGFATGTFEIAELGLGNLRQAGLTGSFGALPPQSYLMLGFIEDGLISHNFLRRYAWTLDFERMVMVFSS